MSQRFKALNLITSYSKKCFGSNHHMTATTVTGNFSLLSTICKPFANGTRCTNCEMQLRQDHGVNYVKIRPRTNEDSWRSQIARRVNVTPINNISMRKIDLSVVGSKLELNEYRRKKYGLCEVNCYQNHNLKSSLSMMPLYFRTLVVDTTHWPRQNYENIVYQM